MRKYNHIFISVVFAVCSATAFADLYQWVDENGVVHLSEKPPKEKPAGSDVETIRTVPAAKQPARGPNPPRQPGFQPPVDQRLPAGAVVWYGYDEGMRRSRSTGRPAIIVLYAAWCPTCRKYWQTFERPSVIEESQKYVMIRVDVDKEPSISSQYNFDGVYVPRTIAVDPSGKIIENAYSPTARHRYFIGTGESDVMRFMKSLQDT